MNVEKQKRIIDEQYFPYSNMTLEERNYYLYIIKNCRDISATRFPVDGKSKCDLVEMRLRKEANVIYMNGSLIIGEKVTECRSIDGIIYLDGKEIIVDYHITRLCVSEGIKEYTVLDEFKVLGEALKRRSMYNFDMTYSDEEEIMKGRIK